jgi:aminoglycoside 2'-N-acetyltransferase I
MLLIHPYNSLSEQEKEIATQFMVVVFGTGYHPEDWAQIDWIIRLFENDRLVSHLTITDRTCDVGGVPIHVGGIGGVGTLPEFRGRGFATQAMDQAVKFMRKNIQVDFGLLFCGGNMELFYKNLGWQRVHDPVYYSQPDRKILDDGLLMYLPCLEQTWPNGIIDVCGLPW